MFHTVAYELSGSNSSLTQLTPVPDGTVNVGSANDIRIPEGMNNIIAVAALINSAVATLRAQIQSPKLRSILNYDISPIANGLVFGTLPRMLRLFNSPLLLDELEGMQFYTQNGANVMNRGLVWLADGPTQKVNGRIYTVRCTAAAALATATWVNSALTFGQNLVAGTYQVVGMRAWSANMVAARLFFVGGAWRPGVPALNTQDNNDVWQFRNGEIGVWGSFKHTVLPSVDCLGVTDTAQEVFLDLIKVA
jgi:hypothetical protein